MMVIKNEANKEVTGEKSKYSCKEGRACYFICLVICAHIIFINRTNIGSVNSRR